MQSEAILEGLNPEQRRAVETTEGPVLVLAGAGSGKTRVLVHRVAYLIGGCGIPPEHILAVTFTNKAAGEMRERVEKILGPAAGALWVSTFHSTCVRILRRDIHHLGLSRGFAIYDDGDSLATLKEALRRRGLDPKAHDPRRLRWRIDQWKNAGWLPAEAARNAQDVEAEQAAELYSDYQRILAEANALDFGDLILQTSQLFERFPEVLRHYRERWHYVLVDEYQDTNRVQYQLVNQLAGGHRNLCAVGDPDQSIYAWRGANIRNILDFERDFPEAQIVKLERNYRSLRPILDGASAVVANNRSRRDKTMLAERGDGELIRFFEADDERDEAHFVVREILAAVRSDTRAHRDIAIFYRTNAQSRPFEEELLKYDIPYAVIGGVRFYDRAEVKDALAYLRLLQNPTDRAALQRVVNRPARGIGKTTLERAEALAERESRGLFDALCQLEARGEAGRTGAKIRVFAALMQTLSDEINPEQVSESVALVLERSGYLASLEKEGTPESEARLENLRELVSAAEDFESQNEDFGEDERHPLERFLDQVALVADVDSLDDRADRVSLMTAHSAKGLEFSQVFLVGLEEGILPHAASARDANGLEEERRLFYVGMTRAMESLVLTCARERRRYGTRTYAVPSRFLSEIPEALIDGEAPRGDDLGPRAAASFDRNLDYSYTQDGGGGEEAIRAGLRVRHPVFGTGTVVAVAGNGPQTKLRIRFERAGMKTILLRFANLELG